MTLLWDAAWPPPAEPPGVQGVLLYSVGDTPNPITSLAMIEAYGPARYRLPTCVRDNPGGVDPNRDATAMVFWLVQFGCPRGVATVLDLETAVDPAYVNLYGSYMHAAGWLVLPYGSRNTLFQNPRLDGYFLADPTGIDHIVAGTVATQFATNGSYDLEDVSAIVPLWDTQPVPPLKEIEMVIIRRADGACCLTNGAHKCGVVAPPDLAAFIAVGIPVVQVSDLQYNAIPDAR